MPKSIESAVDVVVGAMELAELVDQSPAPVQVPEKDPTEEQVRDIVAKIQHPEQWNGYHMIAALVGVSSHTVMVVKQAVEKRIRDLTAVEESVEP